MSLLMKTGCFRCGEESVKDFDNTFNKVSCQLCGCENNASELLIDEICYLNGKIEKLQAENKILREALEYYASVKNWKYTTDSGLDRSEFNDNDDEFIMGEGHVYGKRAREALKKVGKL